MDIGVYFKWADQPFIYDVSRMAADKGCPIKVYSSAPKALAKMIRLLRARRKRDLEWLRQAVALQQENAVE
jgi:hypothetical protein